MKTILFVDDDIQVLDAIIRSLHKESYELLSATSPEKALEILSQRRVDVIVSDEQMPGMLGSELLALAAKDYPETIRIILTGHANVEAAVRAINEGQIYRFLIKPSHAAELAVTIRQALEHKELVDMSRKLLKENKAQSSLLQNLEKEHPGITKLNTDSSGVLILD